MNSKKIFKTLGNVAVVLSLAFVFKKLLDMDIDTNLLFRSDSLAHVAWISFFYGLLMFVLCIPWKVFIKIVSGANVPFTEAAWILNKSNLMKYLPGNVFQFIGRNELAIRLNLSHTDVAFATICDLGLLVTVNLVSSTLLNRQGIKDWFGRYGFSHAYFLLGILAVVGTMIALFAAKRKDTVRGLGAKLEIFLKKRSLNAILACSLYFTLLSLFVAALFLSVFVQILRIEIAYHAVPVVLSGYMFSWIAGFIVPGAPGGIGIREATLTLLLVDVVPLDSALLAAVIFRFISIIGDFWGLLFAWLGTLALPPAGR